MSGLTKGQFWVPYQTFTHTHRHIEADIRIVLESMYLHEMFGH